MSFTVIQVSQCAGSDVTVLDGASTEVEVIFVVKEVRRGSESVIRKYRKIPKQLYQNSFFKL